MDLGRTLVTPALASQLATPLHSPFYFLPGSIRSKNVKNVILWNLLDSAGAGLSYWAVGFAFAYGGDDASNPKHTFVGNTDFFLGSFGGADLQFWFFQWAFASAVSSIVAGTIAERLQMKAYLMYSTFLVGFVYPVVRFSEKERAREHPFLALSLSLSPSVCGYGSLTHFE